MTAKIDGTAGLLQQYDYQTPTTGFSYTFAAGTTVLVMNPAGTLATGTITMPAAPVDGMTISFSSTQAITALTVAGNTGQSIVGQPTTMLAGGAATFVYRLSNTTWYSQANTAQVGSAGSPAPAVTIYSSPATWTKPSTLKAVKVTLVAGGASGGGSYSGAPPTTGGSGGNGGVLYGYAQAPAVPGPVTVTVGSGGAAVGANTNGNPGGTSSFGAIFSTTGGTGGTAGIGGTNGANGANGGSSAITSAPTTSSIQLTAPTVTGVVLPQSWGVKGAQNNAGTGYGAGGGGANNGGPGPAGTNGFIIVEEFY